MRPVKCRNLFVRYATAALAVISTTCGTPTTPGAVVEGPTIQSISPPEGSVLGGTEVTLRGVRFANGATIAFGGRQATDVRVQGTDVIIARTPAGASAGAVDVSVTVDGRTGTLAGGFRYEPVAPNVAPTIRSITAQGKRPRQPANFADFGEAIQITAVVEDSETAPADLAYVWQSACGGTFVGSGPQVEWQTPTNLPPLPALCTINLTVADGPHDVRGGVAVRLHDSESEVGSLALEFLTEFANNAIPAEATVRNFHDSCSGKRSEREDVQNVRDTRNINSHTYGPAAVTIAFGSSCRTLPGDACVITPVEWRSTIKASGKPETTVGTSYITGTYKDSRWFLCASSFNGTVSSGLRFLR